MTLKTLLAHIDAGQAVQIIDSEDYSRPVFEGSSGRVPGMQEGFPGEYTNAVIVPEGIYNAHKDSGSLLRIIVQKRRLQK